MYNPADLTGTSQLVEAGIEYIPSEEIKALFQGFWNSLREELRHDNRSRNEVHDEVNSLVDQLLDSLDRLVKVHGKQWTEELFDVSLLASMYLFAGSYPLT
jgi:hypothetical protein